LKEKYCKNKKIKKGVDRKKENKKRAGVHRRGSTFVLVFAFFVLSYFLCNDLVSFRTNLG
jgi:hypothetical protein